MKQSARTTRGGFVLLPMLLLLLAAALTLSGNAMAETAETGMPCAPTGMESVSTDQQSYPPGETVYISGGRYAVACQVELRITRPDGVAETATVTTDLGGNLSHEYVLPPPPGVLGTYLLEAVGLGGVLVASHTFTDGPEIRTPDLVPGYATSGGVPPARNYSLLVRNTGDTIHRCIRVTLPAGYASISVLSTDASQGSFTSSINGQAITFSNSTGIAATTGSGAVINGWARFDIQATPTNDDGPDGSAWTFRAASGVAGGSPLACPNTNQTSNENVRIVAGTQPIDRRYTAEFVTAAGAPITTPITTDSNVTFRLRMTKLNDGQSNKISYFSVGLPRCLTGVAISSAGENSSNGSDWTAEMFGNVVRWSDPASGELDDGQSVTLAFTANTTGCALGNHVFPSTGWEDAAGSGSSPSKLFTTSASPTVTFVPSNTAPIVTADGATVTVDEGQTAENNGVWGDANLGDTVALSASVGTVTKSGTNAAGTWSWSYPTTDGPDETQVVTITAHDGTVSASTTFQLNVDNIAPSATFNAPESVNEGSNIDLSLSSVVDPGSADTHEYRFKCGFGDWTAYGTSASQSCATTDNGSVLVQGQVRDDDGGESTEYSASVTVDNVAPSATFNAPESLNEGSDINLSLTDVVDPGSADTHEYRFSCDGGETWTDWSSTASDACATSDNGTVEVRGQVRDHDGGTSAVYSDSVAVTNVAPSATFSSPESVNEGSDINVSLSDVVDPGSADTHEYRFKCGSGDWTAYGASASSSCGTTDNGTVEVKGQARDDDGGESAEYSASVTVGNVAPTATFSDDGPVDEGSPINLSLTDVVDPGSADTHEYRFKCGSGDWTAFGAQSTHACATTDNGTVAVKGQVRDDDGGESAEYSASVTVDNVAPSATFSAPETVEEGSAISISLTNASDPSSADTAGGFEYRFSCDNGDTWTDWGAGNEDSCPTSDNGTKSVKAQIRDKDGGTSTYSASLTVTNVAPSATFNAPDSVNEGSDTNLSLTDVVDPGSADTHDFRFSCDGGDTWTAWGNSTHACGTTDNGTVEVRGQVRDDDGGTSDVYSDSVTVNNVAPSATFTDNGPVNEGSVINLSLSDVVDPGSADTHEFRFSCDNGTTWTDWGSTASHSCSTNDNGTRNVKGQVRDDDGGTSDEYSAAVTINNVAPTATFNAPESVDEGSNISLSLTDPSDPSSVDTAAGFESRFSCDDGATWTPWSPGNTHVCSTDDDGTKNVNGEIRDKDGGTSTYSDSVTVNNVAPTATFNAPTSVNEGSNINLSLTAPSDPSSADTAAGFQYAFDCGDGAGYSAYSSSNTRSCPTSDNGTRTVGGRIKDKDGGVTEYSAAVTVGNVPPTLTSLTPSSYLVLKGTAATVAGTYTDPGTGDTFTCVVNWDEPTGTPENTAGGATSCSASHTYTAQGTYTVSMKVRDDDGGESNTLAVIITVYDPGAGGFVTGGGWIISPKGSYADDPEASGRANFGFTSQYKKGASVPTGETEFQLHFATFNFHSEAYDVLVVSGYKAQYRGTGKVNGVSGYRFVLTAYDGQITGGGGADRFRIKITRFADGVVVYDTKMGVSEDMDLADPLALGGGSIVIHKAK